MQRLVARRLASTLALAWAACGPAAATTPFDSRLPRLANPEEVTAAVLVGIARASIAVEGTVYAGIRIRRDGRVEVAETYGVPMTDPRSADLVRTALESMRFAPSEGWVAAHPDRRWAVFWMFQKDGCEPAVYTPPHGTTAVRICMDVRDGRWSVASTYVEFEPGEPFDGRRLVSLTDPPACSYPTTAIREGVQGTVVLAMSVEPGGIARSVMVQRSSGSRLLDAAAWKCLDGVRVLGADGRPADPGLVRFRWTWLLED